MDDHQLIHGECIAAMKELPDASVDLVFTDPPFGHNNNDGDLIANWEKACGVEKKQRRKVRDEARPIENDGDEANVLYRRFLRQCKRLLTKPGCCCCCCCGGGGPDPQFARWSMWMDKYLHFKQMVIWDKGPMGLGWHYKRSYETVLVGQRDKGKCNWYDETLRIENIIRPGAHGIRKIIPSRDQHPTEKPTELAALFIRLHSKPGDVVLDPFMGRGSTGVAAINMGRKFIGIELDKEHYDVAERKIKAARQLSTHGFTAKKTSQGFKHENQS